MGSSHTPHPYQPRAYGTDDPSSSYTRPPPGYAGDESPLLGTPRTSTDNLPDDFKLSTSVAGATIDIRHAFVRKVYAILTVQLVATAILSSISFFNLSFKTWIQTNPGMLFAAMLSSFVFLGLTFWKRHSYPTNLLFLSGFTLLEAYTIAVVTSFYDSRIVLEAVIITGLLFLGLTLFAMQTEYDFMSWASYLYGALWFLVMFGFVALFFPHNGYVELAYSGLAALLFSAYVLFDTQLILRRLHVDEEIAAAVSLYLDIINLFLAYVSPFFGGFCLGGFLCAGG
jgi:FtsH-binding integral membrane protein